MTQDNDEPPEIPRYRVDDETRQMIEAALNMVSQTATLQVSEDGAEGLQSLADEIAHRFYIDYDIINVVDERAGDTEDDPSTLTVYRSRPRTPPTLTVIDGDLNDEPANEDDNVH
tara:strand:+ start:164 stop:508 length:345 start_codon:yes stop_codon:yes gene_type:complete